MRSLVLLFLVLEGGIECRMQPLQHPLLLQVCITYSRNLCYASFIIATHAPTLDGDLLRKWGRARASIITMAKMGKGRAMTTVTAANTRAPEVQGIRVVAMAGGAVANRGSGGIIQPVHQWCLHWWTTTAVPESDVSLRPHWQHRQSSS